MAFGLRAAVAAVALLTAISGSGIAFAQKRGGILRMYSPDSPPTMSILEEATLTSQGPLMGVFNNLVMFDQHVKQDSQKIDRSRSGDGLELERGRHRGDFSVAPGREMA
jgi:hypothetical protein